MWVSRCWSSRSRPLPISIACCDVKGRLFILGSLELLRRFRSHSRLQEHVKLPLVLFINFGHLLQPVHDLSQVSARVKLCFKRFITLEGHWLIHARFRMVYYLELYALHRLYCFNIDYKDSLSGLSRARPCGNFKEELSGLRTIPHEVKLLFTKRRYRG